MRILGLIVLGLTLASIAGQYCQYFVNGFRGHVLIRQFYLDGEANLPTWYQSVTLLFSSALLAAIAWAKKKERDRYALHWKLMSLIFLYLSADKWPSSMKCRSNP